MSPPAVADAVEVVEESGSPSLVEVLTEAPGQRRDHDLRSGILHGFGRRNFFCKIG